MSRRDMLMSALGLLVALTLLAALVVYIVLWHDTPNLLRLFGVNV